MIYIIQATLKGGDTSARVVSIVLLDEDKSGGGRKMLMRLRESIKREGNQQGFTLVELIIVMAILAVLAGMAVPKFGNILNESKQKADAANVRLLQNAVELYKNQTGAYPAGDNAVGLGLLVPNYIKEVPTQVYPVANNGASFAYDDATGAVTDPNL